MQLTTIALIGAIALNKGLVMGTKLIKTEKTRAAICYTQGYKGFEDFEASFSLHQTIEEDASLSNILLLSHWRNIGDSFEQNDDKQGVAIIKGPSCDLSKWSNIIAAGMSNASATVNDASSWTISGEYENLDLKDLKGDSLLIFDLSFGLDLIGCCEIKEEVKPRK